MRIVLRVRCLERRRLQGPHQPTGEDADELPRPALLSGRSSLCRADRLARAGRRFRWAGPCEGRLRVALLQYPARAGLGRLCAKKTGDYSFGGGLLFDRDDWAPPVLEGYCPLPQTPQACNEVFNRTAAQISRGLHLRPAVGRKDLPGHGDAPDRSRGGATAGAAPGRPVRPWRRERL